MVDFVILNPENPPGAAAVDAAAAAGVLDANNPDAAGAGCGVEAKSPPEEEAGAENRPPPLAALVCVGFEVAAKSVLVGFGSAAETGLNEMVDAAGVLEAGVPKEKPPPFEVVADANENPVLGALAAGAPKPPVVLAAGAPKPPAALAAGAPKLPMDAGAAPKPPVVAAAAGAPNPVVAAVAAGAPNKPITIIINFLRILRLQPI